MFSYSTGYYVSPPDDQYLKFKNRCSLLFTLSINAFLVYAVILHSGSYVAHIKVAEAQCCRKCPLSSWYCYKT